MGFTMEAIAGILRPVKEIFSEIIVDKDLRDKLNTEIIKAQLEYHSKFVGLEKSLVQAKRDIIVAEATSSSWITSNWRPITMLTFVFLVVFKWFGWTDTGISSEMELELMSLIKIGLGGYVIGRSAEKIVPKVVEVLKN